MWNPKAQQRERTERLRGWIVYFLYTGRPRPLEMASIWRLLDRHNFPLTRRRLAEEIDYLRSVRLLSVFPVDSDAEVDKVSQAKLIQRFAEAESDEEAGFVLCARVTSAGINFQDGLTEMAGVARVE
jgi:hypothetical protein